MSGTDVAQQTDGELDKPGFAEEALPHMDAVYRFGLRLASGNEHEAEDLVQETFLRAYRSWETYTRGTKCRSWLFTICRNVFLRQQERHGRRGEHVASQIGADLEARAETAMVANIQKDDPERAFFDSIVDAEVLDAVDRLPEEFREAVVLSDIEGLAYAEIAEVLEIPVGTVKSRLYRGRHLLQEVLYEYAREMGYVRERDAS